ncbi:MAG: response regulator transcription factor [Betaproteobacteria bacterium]|nr:MAG: response regulator transcription factor [Betaproteobacteria bacterium]
MTIRVLLADDHTLFREGLRALLQATPDIRVCGDVATGYEAIAAVAECAPDVAIFDIAMPDLNGIDAAAMIRNRHPATRTLILSMHSSVEHVHRAFAAGVRGYLLKESASSEMVRAVRTVHGGALYLCDALRERLGDLAGGPELPRSPLERLSLRERQVLQFVAEGRTSAEIAERIHISPKSVETYRARVLQKLGLENTAALVRFAVEHGLTPRQ